ncbi:hypothetical protein PMIN05_000466 [Paraphaeosphaeria minitans]
MARTTAPDRNLTPLPFKHSLGEFVDIILWARRVENHLSTLALEFIIGSTPAETSTRLHIADRNDRGTIAFLHMTLPFPLIVDLEDPTSSARMRFIMLVP